MAYLKRGNFQEMTKQRKRGLALIVVIGILAIAGIIAVTFAEIMLLQRREASNFLNSLKAQYIAEAGIAKTIADFRSRVPLDGYGTLKTYVSNYVATYGTNVTLGSGRYTLDIQSEEDYFGPKVNINTFDVRDTSQIAVLQGAGLPNREIANIIDYRDYDNSDSTTIPGPPPGNGVENATCKNQPYNSIGEVKAAFLNAGATMTDANNWYNLIEDIITIDKPIMRGGLLAKYYKNINGTSPNITIDETATSYAGEIVELGVFDERYIEGGDADDWDQDSGWNESHDAEFTGGYLLDSPGDFGLTTFAVRWEGYIEIYPAEVGTAIIFRVRVDDGARLFINGNTNLLPAAAWQNQGQTDYSGTYTFRSPGWHRIKIEYYDYTGPNTLRLRWGGTDFNSATTIPAERFGYEPPTEQIPASATAYPYNHAGNYKIIATAQVLSGTSVIAEKRLSATAKVFGTWTQTMRAQWHAAWASDYAVGVPPGYTNADGFLPGSGGNDYGDGEARNVTWLDSCPLDATEDIESGTYTTQADSLKLGFWTDFEDDPGYVACNLKALTRSEKWGSDPWVNITKDDGLSNFFFISWGDVRDEWNRGGRGPGTDGNQELIVATAWHEARRFEVNPFYYFPSGSDPATIDGTPDVFMRVWNAIYPMPGVEAKAYWKGNGTELIVGVTPGFDGFNSSGNPTGTRVGSIPVSGGNELIDELYSGTGFYGWAYDWKDNDPSTNPDIPDGRYQIGERINKVWPAGVSRDYSDNNVRWGTARKALYGTTSYNVENQTGAYSYWQPDIPFVTPMIYVAGERLDFLFGGPGAGARGFGLMEKDNDSFWNLSYSQMEGWVYPESSDMLELTLDSSTGTSPLYNNRVSWLGLDYDHAPLLAIIGNGGSYIGWIRGRTPLGAALNRTAPQSGGPIAATTSVTTPNFQFLSRNVYDVNGEEFSKWMVAEDVVRGSPGPRIYRTGGNADQFPLDVSNNTSMTTYYDNIRIIPASGFLVSTPFFGGETVLWGTVSYTVNTPANTAVTVYLRAAGFAGLPTNDTFSTSFANGASISSTPDRWIQYKAVLTSTAFNPGAAWGSALGGVTPRLDDITITYNPTVQVLAWKEEP